MRLFTLRLRKGKDVGKPMAAELSTTEYAVLGALAEGPSHGFALAKLLAADADLGRVFTVRRPLVYRALDRLVATGLAERVATEQGSAGPQRVVHRVSDAGRRSLRSWLKQPVTRVRDIRIELLLKLVLIDRSGKSPLALIRAQRESLAPTLDAIQHSEPVDHVELWRQHNAAAAGSYLEELERRYS